MGLVEYLEPAIAGGRVAGPPSWASSFLAVFFGYFSNCNFGVLVNGVYIAMRCDLHYISGRNAILSQFSYTIFHGTF